MNINPKTKVFATLVECSNALKPEDLPSLPSAAYARAMSSFKHALGRLVESSYDIINHGFDEYTQQWYAEIAVSNLLNNVLLPNGEMACPYTIKGTINVSEDTPHDCVKMVVEKYNAATDWQRKIISLISANRE
jgi:hypothetical protein